MRKIDDIEVAKMLLDQRKKGILEIAKEPVTVNQMAEQLQDKPSRLYYHVKKLEEAGLLELVETRQINNLIEKWYKRTEEAQQSYVLTDELLKTHKDTVLNEIMKILKPGLSLLEKEMKNDSGEDSKKQLELTISYNDLTGKEWSQSHDRMRRAIKGEVKNDQCEAASSHKLTEEQLEQKSKYVYFLFSYRVDDTVEED